MPVPLNATLVPRNAGDWDLMEDTYLKGGLRVVDDLAARNAITAARRKIGMLVWVLDAGTGLPAMFQLAPDLVSWTVAPIAATAAPSAEQMVAVPVVPPAGDTDSTQLIPLGARITKVRVNVKTPFNGAATLLVSLNGMSGLVLVAPLQIDLAAANLYEVPLALDVGAGDVGNVRVSLGGAPLAGSAEVQVLYVENALS